MPQQRRCRECGRRVAGRHGRFLYLDANRREVWLCRRGSCQQSYEGAAADWEDVPIPAEWDATIKAVPR